MNKNTIVDTAKFERVILEFLAGLADSMRGLPERAIPTKRLKIQKITRFLQPSLSKSVGNNSRAIMSANAVNDRHEAISAFVIPVDRQIPSNSLRDSGSSAVARMFIEVIRSSMFLRYRSDMMPVRIRVTRVTSSPDIIF